MVAAVSLLGAATFAAPAAGAPQALLVAAGGGVTLFCEHGECTADLTTICLQPDREVPARGTAYTVVAEGDTNNALVFVGRRADGSIVDLPSAVGVRIAAERHYLAVRVSVEKAALDRYGIESVTVRAVGHPVLAPASVPGDARPLAPDDVAQALMTLRPIAERTLENSAVEVTAARIMRDAANALSRKRSTRQPEHEAAWNTALTPGAPDQAISEQAQAMARDAFETCDPIPRANYPVRRCLTDRHDGVMERVNDAYWASLKFGS
jgi:hypothetical protein